jgi:hypothetical protein
MSEPIVILNLSQPIQTPAGNLIRKMCYGPFLEGLLKMEESTGYPNNGSEHTFTLKLPRKDIRAFLEIVKDFFGKKYPKEVDAFISDALSRITTGDYKTIHS